MDEEGAWLSEGDGAAFAANHETGTRYLLFESDIICFVQRPPTAAGFHALIHSPRGSSSPDINSPESDEDTYHLPPFARVTIESITPPGEWCEYAANAGAVVPIQRRLYTVGVTYGC